MADNVAITAGTGTAIAADEVTDGTLGTCKVQYVKIMDGTLDGTSKALVGANGLACDVKAFPIGLGKTLKSKTGSASATFTVITAVAAKRLKVYSLSLMTASTTAVTVTFNDGASGTALGTYILQAITGTNFGIVESVAVPSHLFAGTAATLLEMAFSAAQSVTYNLRYWDDDAT